MEKKVEDVIICIDTSRSMFRKDFQPNRLEAVKKGVRYFIERKRDIDSNDRIALISFSSEAKIVYELSNDHAFLMDALEGLQISGTTGLGEGIAVANQLFVKEIQMLGEKLNRIIVISDGKPFASTISPMKALATSKKIRAIIDTVGISELGISYGDSILDKLATKTGGEYSRVFETESLVQTMEGLAEKKEIPYSKSKKMDNNEILAEIAGDLFRPTDLAETQEQLVRLFSGKDKEKCIICFSETCPICHGPFYSCGRYCSNCKSPMHVHCAAEWAAQSKVGTVNTFRCPRCFFLLKVPESIHKLKQITASSKSRVRQETNVESARFMFITRPNEEMESSICPICHFIFSEPPAYLCSSCNTYYHKKCLQEWMDKGNNYCRVCGKKIQL
ncbi:MAG: VWA domain-containing protein [Promethearchaeota archaeon]|nr:MAG: VWA domain-containing protein [Candidatus Lokiarchaeota archaeon]